MLNIGSTKIFCLYLGMNPCSYMFETVKILLCSHVVFAYTMKIIINVPIYKVCPSKIEGRKWVHDALHEASSLVALIVHTNARWQLYLHF
jgi:hypothetical protein